MNKKLTFLAVAITVMIILGGLETTMILYGTEYMTTKPGYSFSVSSGEDWWNCNWSYCKKITIDHTKVEADQTNFPVLINTSSDSDLAAYAQADGDDIVFIDSYNSTQYKHEIEDYDSSTGALTAWVKVPSLSSSSDTIMYIYYGNPTCSNQQNITGTWDSNFIMVQHLNESSDPLVDSTSNYNNGTSNGATYNSSSKIDGGYDFDGSDNITCGNDSSLNITSAITLEGWVKDPPIFTEDLKSDVKIVDKRDEKRLIVPGKRFSVERTVATDKKTELIFVTLFSKGVNLKEMSLKGESIFGGSYTKDSPNSDIEKRIENIRHKLPDKLKELEVISYSNWFNLVDEETIQMGFNAEWQNQLYDGRISYLVISSDKTYDYESTTYLELNKKLTNKNYNNSKFLTKSLVENISTQDWSLSLASLGQIGHFNFNAKAKKSTSSGSGDTPLDSVKNCAYSPLLTKLTTVCNNFKMIKNCISDKENLFNISSLCLFNSSNANSGEYKIKDDKVDNSRAFDFPLKKENKMLVSTINRIQNNPCFFRLLNLPHLIFLPNSTKSSSPRFLAPFISSSMNFSNFLRFSSNTTSSSMRFSSLGFSPFRIFGSLISRLSISTTNNSIDNNYLNSFARNKVVNSKKQDFNRENNYQKYLNKTKIKTDNIQITDVKIIDKREEQRIIFLGKPFNVERTISTNKNTEVIFVALFSPGILLKDMSIDKDSIMHGIYEKDNPNSGIEKRIENIRKMLPDKLKELEVISYSNWFNLVDEETIQMEFNAEWQNQLYDGRISYLVITNDDSYDFEGTTYWDITNILLNRSKPSSIYRAVLDYLKNKLSNYDLIEGDIQTQIDQSLNNSKPVFVFIYDNNCNLCQEEESVLTELKDEYATDIDFIYVHKNNNLGIVKNFNVNNYPTMFLILEKDEEGYIYKFFDDFVNKETLVTVFDLALNKSTNPDILKDWLHGDITIPRKIQLPTEAANKISQDEDAQVIIKFKDGEDLTEKIDYLESVGFVPTAEISSKGLIAGTMDKSVYDNIKYQSDILDVYNDDNFMVMLQESLPLVRFDEAFEEFGVTGKGKKICILDTGVDSSLVSYSYGYDFVNDDSIPDDEHGHGTRVASVIKSIAPDAELIVAKVIGSDGVGYESDVLEALEWCIDQNPDVISFSIGSIATCDGFCDTDFVANMSNDAVDSGIFVVAAAGNDGSSSLKSPACGSKVFSVGATDDNDNIASFSNVNPTLDMFAPGVDIETNVGSGSGTSFSAPFVAGAALLVLEHEVLNPMELNYRLRSTAKPINYTYDSSLSLDIPRLDIYNTLANNKTMEPYDYSWWWQGVLGDGDGYEPLAFGWLIIDGSKYVSCSNGEETIVEALDGGGVWIVPECEFPEWFILDLGDVYVIDKVRGRSNNVFSLQNGDPSNVDIYVSYDVKTFTNTIVEDITTWVNTNEWVEIDTSGEAGRYVKVAVDDTDASGEPQNLAWGLVPEPDKIFDIYAEQGNASVYYFDSYVDDPNQWTNAVRMVDGDDTTYASTSVAITQDQTNDRNTCPGTDLGTISQVEIRAKGYYETNQVTMHLTPVLDGVTDLPEQIFTPSLTPAWSPWFDLTNLPGAPETWSWTNIINLDCRIKPNPKSMVPFTDYCSKIEIRVKFNESAAPPNNAPTQSNPGPANESKGQSVTPFLNVTCTDADGDTMNATWWSNSSGLWVQFASNETSFASGTNINQTNSNFSEYNTTYWWSVNLTDGEGGWNNETYHFTTEADDILPSINFTEPPTPENNTESANTWADVNVTVSDNAGNVSSFIDWDQSLRGYWSMDHLDATGVFDNSTYSNKAYYNGVDFDNSNQTSAIYGDGLEFDGDDDYLNVSDHSSLDITDEITIEAWAKDPPLIPSNNDDTRNSQEEIADNETNTDKNREDVYYNNSDLAISKTETDPFHPYNFLRPFDFLRGFLLKQIAKGNNETDEDVINDSGHPPDNTVKQYDDLSNESYNINENVSSKTIENWDKTRTIIKFKEENLQGSFAEKTSDLEKSGFIKTMEIASKGIVAGFMESSVLEEMKNSLDIELFYPDRQFEVLLTESLPLIRSDDAFEEFGVTGKGKKICILDTGVDSSVVNYSLGYDFVNDDNIPDDEYGHGTMVASIIQSIAPDAELIVAKVIGGNGVGYESDVLAGLHWCIEQEPDVISFSIGAGSYDGFCDSNLVAQLCNQAFNQGIFVVAAAGSDGNRDLRAPACGSNVFSVGATDDKDRIASFSSVNPTLDMFAPGVNIVTKAGSGSGTSLSAPHVGAAALLLLEKEQLSPEDLKYRLRSTGNPIIYTYNKTLLINISRLNIYNALTNNKTLEAYNYTWYAQTEGDGEVYEPLVETGTWVYPEDYDDWQNSWYGDPSGDELNAYDNDTGTSAQTEVTWFIWDWTDSLRFETYGYMHCTKIQFYAWHNSLYCNKIYLDVYTAPSWYEVYDDSFADREYVTVTFSERNITKGSVSFHARRSVGSKMYPDIFEYKFYWLLPTGSAQTVTSVTDTTATLRGLVSDDQGNDQCEHYFEWGTHGSYTDNTGWSGSNGTNEYFTEQITGLDEGTQYNYKARIRNGYNTSQKEERNVSLSTIRSFLTAPQQLQSLSATKYNSARIDLSWTHGDGGDYLRIEYAEEGSVPSPWNPGDGNLLYGYYPGTSYSHTGLDPGTRYYYKVWPAANDYGLTSDGSTSYPYGDPSTDNEWTLPGDPTSLTADNPTNESIDLTWTTEPSHGGDKVMIRRSTSGTPSTPVSGVQAYFDSDTGSYTDDDYGNELDPNQIYYYSIWVYDSESGYYSDVKKSDYNTTLPEPPTVDTLAATNVQETSATVRAEITATGGEKPYRYILWGLDGESFSTNESEWGSGGVGIYSKSLTNLTNGTRYHFEGLANNSVGWVNDSNLTFRTKPQPVSNFGANAINNTRINLTWENGNGFWHTVIIHKADSAPTSRSDGTEIYNGSATSCNDTLLNGFTTYYYRAWSITNPSEPDMQYSDEPDATASATTWSPKKILAKGDAYELSINGTTLYAYLNGTEILNTSIDENWHHVAFTYNGSNASLYVDGNLNASKTTYNEPVKTNSNNLVIGQDLQGALDEVRLWSRALSWEEINASYNASSYYSHNFTGLSYNNYSYYAHAIDVAGNENTTETRYYNCTSGGPVAPTNGVPTLNNFDDADNCYAQKKWYNISVTYTDGNGYENFNYVELRLNQSETNRAIFRYTESSGIFSQEDIENNFELNTTGGSVATKSGNDITVYWHFMPHWAADEESDVDIRCYCIDDTGLNDLDPTNDQFDVITNLLTDSIECNDTTEDGGVDRVSIDTLTQVNFSTRYANDPGSSTGSSSFPPDDEYTSISLYNSSDYNWGTNTSITDGNGTIPFTPDEIGMDNYTLYITMEDGDYTPGEETDPYETIIVDRVNVTIISVVDYIYFDGSRYWSKNTPINFSYTVKLDYDGTNFSTVNGEINAGYVGDSTVWGTTTDLNISVNDSSSGNVVIRDDVTAGSISDGGDYGITALIVTASKPDVGWDWEAPAISVTGESESSVYLYAGYGTSTQGVYGSGMGATTQSYNISGTALDSSGSGTSSVTDDSSFGDNPTNDGNATVWWFIYQIDQDDNGNTIVNFTATDNVSNTNTKNYTFYEDNTNPTLTDAMSGYQESGDRDEVYGNTTSNTLYFSNSFDSSADVNFTATGTDSGNAGVRGINFSAFGGDDSWEDTESSYTHNYTIDDDDTSGTITVIIYDNVNNSDSPGTITCTEDDTNPDTTITDIASTISDLDNINGSATDNIQIEIVHLYIKNTTTNKYYNESGWSDTETWLSADANDSFGSGAENWNYNTTLISWANGHSYEINAKAQDIVGNNDSSAASDTFTISAPELSTVTTNASTGVEEMNATLWGWMEQDGNVTVWGGFYYDTVGNGTTNNQSIGTVTEGDTFSYNAQNLLPGQLYYFRAWGNNSVGINNASNELTFLTKPNATVSGSLIIQANSSSVNFLSWTKGDGANNTYIERNQTGVTSWDRDEGTEIFNSTGTNYEDTGLEYGTTYYYQAWSYAEWTYNPTLNQWSDSNESGSNQTKNKPVLSNENPSNSSTEVSLNPTVNITVNHADGYQMNITWYWGTTDACPNHFGDNSSVGNGTYEMENDNNFSLNSQTYYWKVTVNDGHGEWTNETYHFTTIGANKEIISKTQNAYSLEIHPDGDVLYGYINGNSVSTSIDTEWHYVAVTYDKSNIKIYVDGEYRDGTSLSDNINTNENNLTLGETLTGTLDELRVSDSARSAEWINTTYQNTNSPTTFATFGDQVGVLTTWSYRKPIWIQASKVGTDLANFPVLISTIDSDLIDNALDSGNDILFTDSSVSWTSGGHSEKLAHEIEKFDHTTGELVAWVNVTSLSSTTNTTIYMYYGNTLCNENREDITGVWDSNYVGVWHLHDTPSNGQDHNDSTSNDHDVTFHDGDGDSNTNAVGQIDGADDLNGDADYMNESYHSDFDLSIFTLECWVDQDPIGGAADFQFMINKQIDDYSDRNFALFSNSTDTVPVVQARHGAGNYTVYGTTSLADSGWHYVTATHDDTFLTLYLNGTSEGTPDLADAGPILTQAAPLMIGRENNSAGGEFWDGKIDEVRISKTARNESWINATYNTTSSPITFLEFGAQEIQNAAPTQSNPSPSDGAIGQILKPPLQITVGDVNNDAMNVTFWTNATGSWGLIGYNDSVYNGTYQQTNDSMDSINAEYWWSVNVTDYTLWSNTTYSFTTGGPQTTTLRPNADGQSNQLAPYPAEVQHWQYVDEVNQNGDADFVYTTNAAAWLNDTYDIPDPDLSGDINNITIYLCGRDSGSGAGGTENEMKPVMHNGVDTYYDSDTPIELTNSYVTSRWNYDTNPFTSVNWTWSDITALEIGVALIGNNALNSNCTQVYVEVNYTPSSSPYLYIYENDGFKKLSDFIPGATALDKEYKQFIDITGKTDIMNGKAILKITEELDETTYIDRIYLRIDNHQIIEVDSIKPTISILKIITEQFLSSIINKQLLKHSDNKYLILKEGDEYFLEFTLPKVYDKIEFVAEGYYIEYY